MVGKLLIWLGLFAATATTDWLEAKWVDTSSRFRRANLSMIHEALGFVAGFVVYTWTQDIWTIIPCLAGAWFGSWLAGVEEPLDPAFVQAVHDAMELVNERAASEVVTTQQVSKP